MYFSRSYSPVLFPRIAFLFHCNVQTTCAVLVWVAEPVLTTEVVCSVSRELGISHLLLLSGSVGMKLCKIGEGCLHPLNDLLEVLFTILLYLLLLFSLS